MQGESTRDPWPSWLTKPRNCLYGQRTFSACWKDLSRHSHRKLCDKGIATLHEGTAQAIFLQVKVHKGQLLNEQADTEAEKEICLDAPLSPGGAIETYIEAPIPVNALIKNTNKLKLKSAIQVRVQIRTQDRKERSIGEPSKTGRTRSHWLSDRERSRDIRVELMSTTLPHRMTRNIQQWTAQGINCKAWTGRWTGKSAACALCMCSWARECGTHPVHMPRTRWCTDCSTRDYIEGSTGITQKLVKATGHTTHFETQITNTQIL